MKESYLQKNAYSLILIFISGMTAAISYFVLPAQIPMQWSGTQVNWYAGREAIFLAPLLSIAVAVLFKPAIDALVKRYFAVFPKMSYIFVVGILLLLFSCELYTIFYCFGFRWRIDYIIITESVLIALYALQYALRLRRK